MQIFDKPYSPACDRNKDAILEHWNSLLADVQG